MARQVPVHSKTTTWMGSSRMHPYPPERQLCGFIAEFLDGSSRKGSGWSQHVKQNPKIVNVCHFKSTLRFAHFGEPTLNKVTRMLNLSSSRLSSLKSLVLVPLVSLLAFFFFSCIFPCWSYSALYSLCLVLSAWSCLVLSCLSCLVLSGLIWSWFRLTVVLVLVLGLSDT